MPKLVAQYALAPGGPKRLRLTQIDGDRWAVALDGTTLREIARVPKARQSVELPDGGELVAEWRPGLFGVGEGWHLTRAGKPLPGTVADPARIVDEAAAAFFAAAALLALGAALALAGVGLARAAGLSGWGLVDAGLLALFGRLVHRRSRIGLFAGIAVFVAGSALGCYEALRSGQAPDGALAIGVLVRVAFLVAMARAVPVLARGDAPPAR